MDPYPKSYKGKGRLPPRYGSGGGYNQGDQPQNKPPLGLVILALVGGYSIYQWGLSQLGPILEEEIVKLEEEQALLQEPKPPEPKEQEEGGEAAEQRPLQRQQKGRPMLAVWRARSWSILKKGGILVGSLLSGENLFRRALNATILPNLRQIVGALMPDAKCACRNIALAPLMPIGRSVLALLAPLSRLSTYGAIFVGIVQACKGLCKGLIGGEIVEAVAPLVEPMAQTVQGFFAMGASFTEFFIEKNIKVFIATFMFGGITVHFQGLFLGDKKFWSYVLVSSFSISIFLILGDHIYLSLFVQNLFTIYPKIKGLIEHPLGFVSVVFGGGTVIQSARFPLIVNVFYARMLYVSGIWQDALFPKFPK